MRQFFGQIFVFCCLNPGGLRDFIDVYISEMLQEKDPESSFFGENGRENLIQSLYDLFLAG